MQYKWVQYKWVQSAPKWNCMKFDTFSVKNCLQTCDRPSKFVFNKSLLGAIISNFIPLKVKLHNQYYQ